MSCTHHKALTFVFITLFVDVVGIGIIVPVLPALIASFVGGNESLAAKYYGPLVSTYALVQFLCAPVVGALSDRLGRRPVILLSLLGLGLDYLVLAFAPSMGWLFAGRVIAGIMGASYTSVNAYIADISTPEKRARNFGMVGVAFGLGFIFGPALGGLLGGIHLRLPFFAAAALSLLNLVYGFFVLPESLKPENRSPFSWRKAHAFSSILHLKNYPFVAGLAVAYVLLCLAHRGMEATWVLYTTYRFGWSEMANGLALALVGITAVFVQGFLVGQAVKRLGERRMVLLGLAVSAVSFLCYGLAYKGWMMLVIIVFACLGGMAGPAIQGLIAGNVKATEQGRVQGALTSISSLTAIAAPLLFTTWLFGYFTSERAPFQLPGAPFFLGSLLFLSALVIMAQLFAKSPDAGKNTSAPGPVIKEILEAPGVSAG